ncbi:MAG: glycosyltransferase family 2 protein [Candidatus Omnitrophica bacterium]|nr:glycosyltransferase family 2 protein [Candidatus Omnitrophota bacterium]
MKPISVVIPAYNESRHIATVIGAVTEFMKKERIEYEIIVVDDFSTDDTAQSAERAGATVISHPMNRGYGASLTTGIKKSRYNDILIMDADGTYPVPEIKKLLPYIGDFDMVVGARQGKHYHGSPVKRISRGIFYLLISYVTGDHVPDANSGLRIFRKDVVMKFEDDFCSGFSFTTTITLVLLCNNRLIKFVPIDYQPRVGSKSKVRYFRDTARTFQILLQTVSYYIPLKAFLPFTIISLLLSLVFTILYFAKAGNIFYGLSAVVTFLSSMAFLGLGLIAYSIVRGKKGL